MRVAVTYDHGQIFQHFGHTEQFKLYDIEDGKVRQCAVLDADGYGHGALATFLRCFGVEVLICGGIGGGAQTALADAGIKLYGGVSGSADAAVLALINGELDYDPNVHCDHHDHEEGHSCSDAGGHNCASHGCGHGCH